MGGTSDVLIRLTPSARRRIVTSRPRWGWQPGMPVLISRAGGSYEFFVPRPDTGPTVEFESRGIRIAVPVGDADYFRGSVLSSNYEAMFGDELWWMENPNDLGRSGCSDPLGASCSAAKFRQIHPELFGLGGLIARLRGGLARDDREQIVARPSAYLRWGDGRAAVVLQLTPLIVAAYCDEMDAAILLRFPDAFVRRYSLGMYTPLVTTNLHDRTPDGVVQDLTPGPRYCGRFTNVRPLIADFLAAEEDVVQARRKAISDAEYGCCRELGEKSLRDGQPIRSGRPLEAGTPGAKRA